MGKGSDTGILWQEMMSTSPSMPVNWRKQDGMPTPSTGTSRPPRAVTREPGAKWGVSQDYTKAYSYLYHAYNKGSKCGVFFLAKCFFYGLGTGQDYNLARQLLERMNWNYWEADYLRGMIYANGLGVTQDILKGVAYLQKISDYEEARLELSHYKKTLFGKWVRR